MTAARCGAEVSLAGGVGEDAWGEWLEQRLRSKGVGLRWLARMPGFPTPLAFVLVNEAAEPDFIVYGEGIEAGILFARGGARGGDRLARGGAVRFQHVAW